MRWPCVWTKKAKSRPRSRKARGLSALRRGALLLLGTIILLLLIAPPPARAANSKNGQRVSPPSAALALGSRERGRMSASGGDPCANTTVNNPDPITGLPVLPANSSTPPPACPVPVSQSCPAPVPGRPATTDWLLGSTNGLLVSTSAAATYGSPTVFGFWKLGLAVALALLGVPLVLAGLQVARGPGGSGRADATELLSRVLLAALAAGLSVFAIGIAINLESTIVNFLYNTLPSSTFVTFMPSANWGCNAQQFFGSVFNLSVYTAQNTGQQIDAQQFARDNYLTVSTLVSNLGNYVLTLLSVLLAIQLSVRLALLNVYIIVSPVTVICHALPGQHGARVTRAWLGGFMNLLFVQLLQFLVLWLGAQLVPLSLFNGSDWLNLVFQRVIPLMILGLTMGIPRLLSSPATTLMSTVSSSIGGAMTGVILIIRGI